MTPGNFRILDICKCFAATALQRVADARIFSRRGFVSLLVALALLFGVAPARGASLSFEGIDATRQPIAVEVPTTTGLECIYVVCYSGGATAVFDAGTSGAAASTRWQRFSNLGGGFATDIQSYAQGSLSKVRIEPDDAGYIVESGARRYCFWVVNYNNHVCTLTGLEPKAGPQDCDRIELDFAGDASLITYYTINGVGHALSRELQLTYNTLQFNEEKGYYENVQAVETLDYASAVVRAPAPLCDTEFTLSGDRFLSVWGAPQSVTSSTYRTQSIGVSTSAQQTSREVLNEQKDQKARLGGSGPVEITFTAATTDAVVYREWQFSRNREFDPIDLRYSDDEVVHTFRDYGNTYVRFVAANADNSCTYTSQTYEVYIGESKLDCPNAFSPYGSEGVNDEWKVSYKSIIEFDCHIFNRWGTEMTHFTDPAEGWDGTYRGKLVPPGVYYYVIKATGTDGQEYKLAGDINILKYTTPTERN